MSFARSRTATALATLLALAALGSASAAPWTYRGTLSDGGKPAQGQYDLRLTLLDDGRALTQPLTLHGVAVDNGNFAVEVDFGVDLSHAPPLQLRSEVQRSDQSGGGFVTLGEPTRFDAKAALGGVCWDTLGNAGTNPALNFIGTPTTSRWCCARATCRACGSSRARRHSMAFPLPPT